MSDRAYIRDGAEIYRRSFAIIRAESDLGRFSAAEEPVAVRIIHACGMTEIARDIVMSPGFAERARAALLAGAPILCDSKMVVNGITRARLPAANAVVCTLDDPAVPVDHDHGVLHPPHHGRPGHRRQVEQAIAEQARQERQPDADGQHEHEQPPDHPAPPAGVGQLVADPFPVLSGQPETHREQQPAADARVARQPLHADQSLRRR